MAAGQGDRARRGELSAGAVGRRCRIFIPSSSTIRAKGTQAKRRTGAVIIDHLVPPLTRAETYGPLKDLEALLDEYYAASGMDKRRLKDLQKRILDFTRDTALDRDIGLPEDGMEALQAIDNFLCELKEAQIRDGLHVFGQSPEGGLETRSDRCAGAGAARRRAGRGLADPRAGG